MPHSRKDAGLGVRAVRAARNDGTGAQNCAILNDGAVAQNQNKNQNENENPAQNQNGAAAQNLNQNQNENSAQPQPTPTPPIPRNFKILVAPSGSTDATLDILARLQRRLPELDILPTPDKTHGAKCIALYRHACENGATWVFQTDSDGQTNPREFAAFWAARAELDAVFGYRRVRGDGAFRKFVEGVVCALLWAFFGVRVRDANAPFRLMRAPILAGFCEHFAPSYNLPNIMLTAFFVVSRRRVAFREITFKARSGGKNSVNFVRIFKIGLRALVDFWRFRKVVRGMKMAARNFNNDGKAHDFNNENPARNSIQNPAQAAPNSNLAQTATKNPAQNPTKTGRENA